MPPQSLPPPGGSLPPGPSPAAAAAVAAAAAAPSSPSIWDRISDWAAENKATVYTLATITILATSAGIYYISNSQTSPPTPKGKSRGHDRSKRKSSEKLNLSKITPEYILSLPADDQKREKLSIQLKEAGNAAFKEKNYENAITLYTHALLCKKNAVFYANRAACYSNQKKWDLVVEDATRALKLEKKYQKALNRRAAAYHELGQLQEALNDYTALCMLHGFQNQEAGSRVEEILQEISKQEARKIIESRKNDKYEFPSSTFVSNYLKSFRPEEKSFGPNIVDQSGLYFLNEGVKALERRIGDEYTKAAMAFEKAIEVGDLGEHEAYAYNMRGTFRYLMGDADSALNDLNESIRLDPTLTQSYIKRSTIHLERNDIEAAHQDFDLAIAQNKDDPNIYYHRAQLNFVLTKFQEAIVDYEKSVELDDKFVYSHVQLAVAQYRKGDIDLSNKTFEKCIKDFGDNSEAHNFYGELLLDQNKVQEAISHFEKAMMLEKENNPTCMNVLPLVNKALAIFINNQGPTPGATAREICQAALILDPGCEIAHGTRAQLSLQQGLIKDAYEHFEAAAKLGRTELEITNALSYAHATKAQMKVQEDYPDLAASAQFP